MLAKIKILFLTILNWEKWNPRKDLKTTSWFRFQNSIFDDPQFFEFDHSELLFFIYLLSLASKKQSGDIEVHVAHAQRIGRFETSTINSAIKKLSEINCVRTRDVDVTSIPADVPLRTNERNEHNTTNGPGLFDENSSTGTGAASEGEAEPTLTKKTLLPMLDKIYSKYPRKEGKSEAYDRLCKILKTEADCADLDRAVTNYARAKAGVEKKHLRMFSSFIGTLETQCWRDWINPDPSVFSPHQGGSQKAMRKVGANVQQ